MYTFEDVTENINAWFNKDPVRPELDPSFRTANGRRVYALKREDGGYASFVCVAYVSRVPKSVEELDTFADKNGDIAVPYTVWRYDKGAGREILIRLIHRLNELGSANRLVTLSPKTEMAEKFHLRNGAIKLGINNSTVNFEYSLAK